MLTLGNTLKAIKDDRHRKYITDYHITYNNQPEPKNNKASKNASTQTIQVYTKNASCDTKELEIKEKERKALEAFKKRIEEQKIKAQQMKQFLGNANNQEEDNIEDE